MNATRVADTLARVTDDSDESRGAAIERRMKALGMGPTELSRDAGGVSRKTIYRAMADDESVTDKTYQRLEGALSRVEADAGYGSPDAVLSTEQGLIEVDVTGDFGVRIVVKAPVENADELEAMVARLIRDIREK